MLVTLPKKVVECHSHVQGHGNVCKWIQALNIAQALKYILLATNDAL